MYPYHKSIHYLSTPFSSCIPPSQADPVPATEVLRVPESFQKSLCATGLLPPLFVPSCVRLFESADIVCPSTCCQYQMCMYDPLHRCAVASCRGLLSPRKNSSDSSSAAEVGSEGLTLRMYPFTVLVWMGTQLFSTDRQRRGKTASLPKTVTHS